MNSMGEASTILGECETIYMECLKEEPAYKGKYRYLIPAALRFARTKQFSEADECVRQIETENIGSVYEKGQYYIALLEVSLLKQSPSKES